MVSMTGSQARMVNVVHRLAGGFQYGIPVGPNQRDTLGRQLDLSSKMYAHLYSSDGLNVSTKVKGFLNRLQNEESFRLGIQAALAGYDIRMEYADDAFWVLVAQAYAKQLVDRTGKRDGHIIHLGADRYEKHYRVNSLIAYTLIKTGICDNGGGIVYWGISDGGSMKSLPMLERAQNGEGGHWGYGTVSHLTREELSGFKMGTNGQVMCTDVLMENIFDNIMKGEFLPLKKVERPGDFVVTVGDTIPFRTGVAANVVRARTNVSENTPEGSILEGVDIGVPTEGNQIMETSARVLANLGANVVTVPTGGRDVFDPHESESENIGYLANWAEKNGKLVFVKDPDGDRVSIIFLDSNGKAHNVKGTMLAALAAHNLATHNPIGLPAKVVADMRAFMAIDQLGKGLTAAGFPIEMVPSSPGYDAFHLQIAESDAAIGVEETSHTMVRPYSHALLGAPKHYEGVQGGDNAGLFGIWMLALSKYMWEGRNALDQLAYIRKTFGMPNTNPIEYKPKLEVSHGMAKVVIAESIKEIVERAFGGNPIYRVVPLDTGIYILNTKLNAAVLIRHSKSGSSFTINREFMDGDNDAAVFTNNLGIAIILKAAELAKIKMNDSGHKYHALKDFVLDLNDAAEAAKSITNPDEIINHASRIQE